MYLVDFPPSFNSVPVYGEPVTYIFFQVSKINHILAFHFFDILIRKVTSEFPLLGFLKIFNEQK
jgi:hypothetical protein